MIEVLKQALEDICGAKLCESNSMSSRQEMLRLMDSSITSLRQAIAELESQEPVAHCTVRPLRGDESYPKTEILWVKGKPIAGPLYTHPPQRTEDNT
jgi:hypothetical protein